MSNEYIFPINNELKWVSYDMLYFPFTLYAKFEDLKNNILKDGKNLSDQDRQGLEKTQHAIDKMKVDFKGYANFTNTKNFPNYSYFEILSPKAATRIQNAFVSSYSADLLEIIDKQLSLLNALENVRQELIKQKSLLDPFSSINKVKATVSSIFNLASTNYQQFSNLVDDKSHLQKIKNLQKLKTQLSTGLIGAQERNTKNRFIRKEAWSIFETQGDSSGFKGKNGEIGDISIARLFDSDQGANRTARAMGLRDYEIVEVEVQLKKRTNINPSYHDNNLNAALSILEKEKIEQFFKEIPLQDIEERLGKEKEKKKHKI